MSDIHYLSIAEAGKLIEKKEALSVRYVEALLARIDLQSIQKLVHSSTYAATRPATTRKRSRPRWQRIPRVSATDLMGSSRRPTTPAQRTTAHSSSSRRTTSPASDAATTAKPKAAGGIFVAAASRHTRSRSGRTVLRAPWPSRSGTSHSEHRQAWGGTRLPTSHETRPLRHCCRQSGSETRRLDRDQAIRSSKR